MAVNNAWQLVPWADALYACDGAWWKEHGDALDAAGFSGLRLTQDAAAANKRSSLRRFELQDFDRLLLSEPGVIGNGGNGGFQALNIALHFGARRIALAGFDMTIRHGVHWHGEHPKPLRNPDEALTRRWRGVLDDAATVLAALDVALIDCAPQGALTKYPKASLAEALTLLEA